MKKIITYSFIAVLTLITSLASNGQTYVADGYVIVEDRFLPVEGQIIEIKSEGGNVISSVITNETGYFYQEFTVAEGDEFITLEMVRNCSGEVFMYSEALELNNSHVSHIFFVCNDIPCGAMFNYEQQAPNALVFEFTDVSLIDVDSWSWDFGDGNTSTLHNPVHEYETQGNYTVTLTIENESCTDETQRTLQAFYNGSLAKFSFEQVNQGEQLVINFTNHSMGYYISNYWDFGEGGFSYDQNPKHAFTYPGDYNVTLTIFSPTSYSSLRKTVHVTPVPECFALFNHVQALSSNLTVQFEDISVGKSILFWYWQFGDGQNSEVQNPEHIYQNTGTYEVSLRVISTTGQSFYTRTIQVKESTGCVADFNWIQPNPDDPQVVFNSLTANSELIFEWDFGDGETSQLKSPAHQYDDWGTYVVTLDVLGYGCTDVKSQNVVLEEPVYCDAKFSWEQAYPQSRTISFVNQSFGDNPAFLWDFGDGNTSADISPEHTYNAAGNYTVKLRVEAAGNCLDSTLSVVQILPPLNLSGYVYAGNSVINLGSAYLYRLEGNQQMAFEGRSPLQNGFFEFVELVPGNYFVQAIPEYEFPYPVIPFYYPVYSGGVTQWQFADVISTSSLPQDLNLNLEAYDDFFSGKASVSGIVLETGEKDDRPLIFYLSDDDEEIFHFTRTDASGRFSFENIPYGNYSIIPEKAGKTAEPFDVELNATYPEMQNIVFLETALTIKPDLSRIPESDGSDALTVYPNPASDHIFIIGRNTEVSSLKVKILNPVSQQVIFHGNVKTGGKVPIRQLPDGVYVIEIFTGKMTFCRKLIVSH